MEERDKSEKERGGKGRRPPQIKFLVTPLAHLKVDSVVVT